MTAPILNILLVGFGNMGQALYNGWRLQNHKIYIVDPAIKEGTGARNFNFSAVTDQVRDFAPDLIVFAVKPQIIDKVLQDYQHLKDSSTPVLSIMAGVEMARFSDFFGVDTPVIRSMPNMPALIGQGITVCIGNANATKDHRKMVDQLLTAIGQVEWVDDEELMHGVTALSGSGPAYVFYMIEAMAAAGIASGLPDDLAMRLARETVIGSAKLLESSNESATALRERVTSPNGTTQAALDVLMKDGAGLKKLMKQAIISATKRSQDLG